MRIGQHLGIELIKMLKIKTFNDDFVENKFQKQNKKKEEEENSSTVFHFNSISNRLAMIIIDWFKLDVFRRKFFKIHFYFIAFYRRAFSIVVK